MLNLQTCFGAPRISCISVKLLVQPKKTAVISNALADRDIIFKQALLQKYIMVS